MERFDIAIIGGGPAGYYAAERAAEEGLAVALAEKGELGGVCLNEGCIPTKTWINSGKILQTAKKSKGNGVSISEVAYTHALALKKKNEVVRMMVHGLTIAMKKKNVRIFRGEANVIKIGENYSVKVGNEEYVAKNILIATGSETILPPVPGLQEEFVRGNVLTSREILDLSEVPRKLFILGGGVIGLEMAEYFSTIGSNVTIVEMLSQIGGIADEEASTLLQKHLEAKGATIYLNAALLRVEGGKAILKYEEEEKEILYDKLLVSVGRRPSVKGLENLDLFLDAKGAIVTDDYCRTNLLNVYAAGDVNGKYMLAHVAYREAHTAISHILGQKDAINYSAVPGIIYTDPEIAWVGMTEKEAKEKGYQVTVKKTSINNSGRHLAEHGLSDGFCKLVIDQKTDLLLGGIIASACSSEIIYPLCLIIQNKIPLESVKRTIFPHPTVCEIIRETIIQA